MYFLSFLVPLYIFGQIMTFILIDLNDYFVAAQSSYTSPSRLFCFWFVMEEMWFNYLVTCLLDLLCSAGLDAKQVIEGNCGLAGRPSFRPNHRYRSHLGEEHLFVPTLISSEN